MTNYKTSCILVHLLKQDLLQFVLEHVEDKNVEALLEVCEILMLEITFFCWSLYSNVAFLYFFGFVIKGFARGSSGAPATAL